MSMVILRDIEVIQLRPHHTWGTMHWFPDKHILLETCRHCCHAEFPFQCQSQSADSPSRVPRKFCNDHEELRCLLSYLLKHSLSYLLKHRLSHLLNHSFSCQLRHSWSRSGNLCHTIQISKHASSQRARLQVATFLPFIDWCWLPITWYQRLPLSTSLACKLALTTLARTRQGESQAIYWHLSSCKGRCTC